MQDFTLSQTEAKKDLKPFLESQQLWPINGATPMYNLAPLADLRAYGFIFLADYGGGTWTNGRIHFFNGTLCDIGKPTIKDFTTMRKMELQGIITATPQEGKEKE